MIVVSGSMRSGTSAWMQILVAAGFPAIGDAFPKPWGEGSKVANPRGFYESQLVAGIFHATNPHPETGAYLHPAKTRKHVAKVFIPGLIRSDVAFLDRVLVTVRPWRVVARSIAEMKNHMKVGPSPTLNLPEVPPGLHWWAENFSAIRDIALRGYPAHVLTYDRLVEDPEREIRSVLQWLEGGDLKSAVAAVDTRLNRSFAKPIAGSGLTGEQEDLLDELYEYLYQEKNLPEAFLLKMNRQNEELQPSLRGLREAVRATLLSRFAQIQE